MNEAPMEAKNFYKSYLQKIQNHVKIKEIYQK